MVLGLIEWTVRMVMLVLAGLVTLAILHAMHAMSTDAGGPAPAPQGRPVPIEQAAPQQQPRTAPRPVEEQKAAPAPQREAGGSVAQEGTAVAAAPPQDERLQRWVEAIAYALLALAGLAAIGLILLWQLLRQTRRLADAAEARPRGA
jgi:hypothetical protein